MEISSSLSIKGSLVSDAAMKLLYEYDWPENVRELSSVMAKAMVLCESAEITPDHLQLAGAQQSVS